MINVEKTITQKFPSFASKPALIRSPTLSLLKKLMYEKEINRFLNDHCDAMGVDFIDRVFEFFNFSYNVTAADKKHIPRSGKVVIIANHPIGSLDGLATLKLISEVRPDVKVVANDMLMTFENLHELFIPLDNMSGGSPRRSYRRVIEALNEEQAVIIFPAGEVSRASPTGVRDGTWRPGFLHFCRKTNAPLLPIHIAAKNSLLFYGASAIFKPLGTALLTHEMFNKHSSVLTFSIGELIPLQSLSSEQLLDRTLVKRLKQHIYTIGKTNAKSFAPQRKIAPPESTRRVQEELSCSPKIGCTRDNNQIYLVDYCQNSAVLKEVGRLREIAFRAVGEGTGRRRDIDGFDRHYRHLVLWNAKNQEIAGSYRIGEGKHILGRNGIKGLYTSTLYRYSPEIQPYFEQGVELGRSFVAPQYWGKACLDYLWQGLGAYLAHNPNIRYLIGPVSMSADYPKELIDTLVYFYRRYYACPLDLAKAHHPYLLTSETLDQLEQSFDKRDSDAAFDYMQTLFAEQGHKLPVLFKQYTALFHAGGFQSIVFSRDPEFGDCLDGLFMADMSKLKLSKRKRYIGV